MGFLVFQICFVDYGNQCSMSISSASEPESLLRTLTGSDFISAFSFRFTATEILAKWRGEGEGTSVSGGQLNDDDHCFHLSELNLKKYACALKRTARVVAGNNNSIKDNKYILLTKREGCTGRISACGLDSTDRAQRGAYKKDRGPIFSQYGPEQAWLIRDLLHD